MPDFNAIAVALAARYAPAQVTPPGTLTNIRWSVAAVPNQLGPFPCVVVLPVTGDFATGNGTRQAGQDWVVRFYLAEAMDLARDATVLNQWLTVLADQLRTSVQLGGTVTSARVMGYTVGLMKYAGIDYAGIELRVRIVTDEGWAAVA